MSIIVNHLYYRYNPGTAMEQEALKDINLIINDGEFIGLIGHTGSGKSTLVQHLNGILKASEGWVLVDGESIYDKDYDMKKLRSRVGLVFQYPEHQLFEKDVFTDVCFGPGNLGLDKKEVQLRAYEALKLVGIEDEYFYQSPFDLSGGQKRRVAIAGVLAMKPKVLILDEPTAGLDPLGRRELLDMLKKIKEEMGCTIVLVSHSMEDMAEYAERIVVMNEGRIVFADTPAKVFSHYNELKEMGLGVPAITETMIKLKAAGFDVPVTAITVKEAVNDFLSSLM